MPGNSSSVVKKHHRLKIDYINLPVAKIEMRLWQRIIKRVLDVIASVAGLLLLSPLFIYIAIRIKLDSKGAIFYFQERIGYNGIAFIIYKFRSMYEGSERNGPTLSCFNDKRVTKWGATIRKWKLDELPQLLNVLLGDMSLVGPRPERKYYIDKVSAINPYFKYLHQVKPGLTSMGMIRFGYAQNVEQIIQRMKYDIGYIESFSLALDFQIIYYTFLSIVDSRLLTAPVSNQTKLSRIKIQTLN